MLSAVELPLGTGDVVLVGEGSPTREVLDLQGNRNRVVCRGSRMGGLLQEPGCERHELGQVSLQTLGSWFWPGFVPG